MAAIFKVSFNYLYREYERKLGTDGDGEPIGWGYCDDWNQKADPPDMAVFAGTPDDCEVTAAEDAEEAIAKTKAATGQYGEWSEPDDCEGVERRIAVEGICIVRVEPVAFTTI